MKNMFCRVLLTYNKPDLATMRAGMAFILCAFITGIGYA